MGGNHESEKLIAIDKYSNIATALAVTKGAAFYRNTQEKISRKHQPAEAAGPNVHSSDGFAAHNGFLIIACRLLKGGLCLHT